MLAVTRGSSVTSVRICKMNVVTYLRKQGNRGSGDIDLKTLCKFGAGSTPVMERTDHTSQGVRKFVIFLLVKKFPRCGTRRFIGWKSPSFRPILSYYFHPFCMWTTDLSKIHLNIAVLRVRTCRFSTLWLVLRFLNNFCMYRPIASLFM